MKKITIPIANNIRNSMMLAILMAELLMPLKSYAAPSLSYLGLHVFPTWTESHKSTSWLGPDDEKNTSYGLFNGTIGINGIFNKNFPVEVEIGRSTYTYYTNHKTYTTLPPRNLSPVLASSTTVQTNSSVTYLLLNSKYNFKIKLPFVAALSPYITAGIGYQNGSTKSTVTLLSIPPITAKASVSDIAYQIGTGLNLPITDVWTIDGRVRYTNTCFDKQTVEFGITAAL